MYKHFEEEIAFLKREIINMSIIVEEMIFNSVIAVKDYDVEIANRVLLNDDVVDKMEINIEERCTEIILRYHPLAGDLRFVLASLKINNDLERIADLACDISQRVFEIYRERGLRDNRDIEEMGHLVIDMLRKSIKSITDNNIEIAKEVILFDSKIDEMRNKISDDLISLTTKNSERARYYFSLILVSRHLERIADHCVNIAEDVIYILDSRIVRHHNQEL